MTYSIRWIEEPETRLSPFLPAIYKFDVIDEQKKTASTDDNEATLTLLINSQLREGFTLYADQNGQFTIDLQPSLQAISLRKTFLDNQQPTLDELMTRNKLPAPFQGGESPLIDQRHPFYVDPTLAWTVNLHLSISAIVTESNIRKNITLTDDTKTLQQTLRTTTPIDYRDLSGPRAKGQLQYPHANLVAHAVYFRGYPFDLPIIAYTQRPLVIFLGIDLKNNTTGQTIPKERNMTFVYDPGQIRFQLSDGKNDLNTIDYLPLASGPNELQFQCFPSEGTNRNPEPMTYILDVRTEQPGIYLRWINSAGTYSYWLFTRPRTIHLKTKSATTFDNPPVNLPNFRSKTTVSAIIPTQTVEIISQPLEHHHSLIVRELYTSPSVELYTGKPYALAKTTDWIAVDIQDGSAELWNTKNNSIEYKLKINIPTPYLQSL